MGAAASTGVGDSNAHVANESIVRDGGFTQPGSSVSKDAHADLPELCSSPQEGSRDGTHSLFSEKTSFDNLPDEVLIKILAAVSSSADKPADIVAPSMTCRRWRVASRSKEVRRRTSKDGVGIRASHWGEGAMMFLQKLCDAGCLEACFMLGMILVYCIPGGQLDGGRLLLHSARAGHHESLHNVGIMSFTGGLYGGFRRDLRAGVTLCARAAALGNPDAMREVGLCLLDGFGVKQDRRAGLRMLLLSRAVERHAPAGACDHSTKRVRLTEGAQGKEAPDGPEVEPSSRKSPLLANTASCQSHGHVHTRHKKTSPTKLHPAHRFLLEWFKGTEEGRDLDILEQLWTEDLLTSNDAEIRCCSRGVCGRRELRPYEFWRCAGCMESCYCSRSCQMQDWSEGHSSRCVGDTVPPLVPGEGH